jgi:hypothetical protein
MSLLASNSTHQDVFLLLPWYANGTLTLDEHQRVRQHLAECRACEEELELLNTVYRSQPRETGACEVSERGLERLNRRIEQSGSGRPGLSNWLAKRWRRSGARPIFARLSLAAAIPLLLLLVTGLWLMPQAVDDDARYETLSSAQGVDRPIRLELRVMAGTQPERLHRALDSELFDSVLEISPDGSYVVRLSRNVSPGEVLRIIRTLESNPSIRSVEPVTRIDGME